jgi:hypothetical protein
VTFYRILFYCLPFYTKCCRCSQSNLAFVVHQSIYRHLHLQMMTKLKVLFPQFCLALHETLLYIVHLSIDLLSIDCREKLYTIYYQIHLKNRDYVLQTINPKNHFLSLWNSYCHKCSFHNLQKNCTILTIHCL